jgi:hypothetical protein
MRSTTAISTPQFYVSKWGSSPSSSSADPRKRGLHSDFLGVRALTVVGSAFGAGLTLAAALGHGDSFSVRQDSGTVTECTVEFTRRRQSGRARYANAYGERAMQ